MRLCFEGFEVLPHERQLLVAGSLATIGARAFDVLLALIEHSDRVVTKGELLASVWSGLMVEENNLQVQISGLRKLLGQRAIATIPGRGYRFTMAPRSCPAPIAIGADPGLRTESPSSPDSGPRRDNLPEHLPPLYGRDTDLGQVRALVETQRTVTIVATGGVGKTQLARAIAVELRGAYAGVWWVELAELRSGHLVASEVARVLGCQVMEGRSALETVVDVLRTQDTLLLLDNCEHLLPAIAALVEVVNEMAPRVRVLVTSQEPLKVPHERVYRLGTLALPSACGLEAARHSGAVQLFVSRIQSSVPHFVMTAANVERVVAICQRLDGIALALELAAARVPLLGLEGLYDRLDERFKVLTGGSRSMLRRHQTLRAALDFSHSLLSPVEQTVFRRLGAFAGSFSAGSALEVVSDERIDCWSVLDHLGALVDKSMVLAEQCDPPRLRLLETTRAYALERMEDAGETTALRELHARTMGRMIADAADAYWVLSDTAMLARYGPETANLRTALDWALVHDRELAMQMIGNACGLWREALGQQPEGARYCEAALALVSERTPLLTEGRLWYTLAWMLIWSQQQRARAAALRAASLLRQVDDPATLGMTLLLLIPGTTALDAQQIAALDEIRRLHVPAAPPRVRAQLLSASARLNMGAGNYAEATRLYNEARALLADCGAAHWEGVLAWTVAGIAMVTDELDFAVATLRETARRLELLPSKGVFLAFSLGSLATAHLLQSDTAAAREALARAAPLITRYDLGSRYAATAAWLATQEARWQATAQLLGYGRAAAASSGVDAEEPAEITARTRASACLAGNASAADIDDWMRAGALMSTHSAYQLALDSQAADVYRAFSSL